MCGGAPRSPRSPAVAVTGNLSFRRFRFQKSPREVPTRRFENGRFFWGGRYRISGDRQSRGKSKSKVGGLGWPFLLGSRGYRRGPPRWVFFVRGTCVYPTSHHWMGRAYRKGQRTATIDTQRISAAMTEGACRKRRPNLTCTRFCDLPSLDRKLRSIG